MPFPARVETPRLILRRFEQIRKLQDVLVERARASGAPVIDATNLDAAVGVAMQLVRDAVSGERAAG